MQTVKRKVIRFSYNSQKYSDDDIIKEDLLTISVNGERAYFCMRLPGMDRELAAGILYNDGVISSCDEITSIECSGATVDVIISGPSPSVVKRIYSSTGGISSSDLIAPAVAQGDFSIITDDIFRLKEIFLSNQRYFEITGGTHCAALFDRERELIAFAEDVGRHNALDKCTGAALLGRRLADAAVVMLSSRLSLEMIKKSYRTGALLVAGVSAPTSAAVDAADDAGITLIGFLREGRFNVYSNPHRIKGITA